MGLKIGGEVEKVNGKELSYDEFVERYMAKNQPVVVTGLMDDWRACKDWVLPNRKPNLHFFATHFGNSKVQVADCSTKEFTDQKRLEMSVSEFVDHWLRCSNNNERSDTAVNRKTNSLMYLKDWHFVKEYPEYLAYSTPLFFCDDWLNMYLDKYHMHDDPVNCLTRNEISCSDYRFVYMGVKGTWTPLHADVFRSYSWSGNVCGKKQWYFLSPDQFHLVFDRYMKNSVYDIFEDVSEKKFPGFDKAVWLECTQQINEIIFVPSLWYHQVQNLEDTISINHNWFNAYNLCWVLDLLSRDYNEAKEYIEDIKDICDDFEGLCQRNLAANTGMNFYDLFTFMVRLSFANVALLYDSTRDHKSSILDSSKIAQQTVFNLEAVRDIAFKMRCIDFSGNCGGRVNIQETLMDPNILKLRGVLGTTYCKIHGQGYEMQNTLEDDELVNLDVEFSDYHFCTPEDLVSFIDHALKKLGGIATDSVGFSLNELKSSPPHKQN